MFTSKYLVLFIAALLAPSIAAPMWHGGSDTADLQARAPTKGAERFRHAAQAVKTINKVNKVFHPKEGEAVFWSGTRKGPGETRVSVHGDAQKFAHEHGKSTINHGLSQHGVRIPDRKEINIILNKKLIYFTNKLLKSKTRKINNKKLYTS